MQQLHLQSSTVVHNDQRYYSRTPRWHTAQPQYMCEQQQMLNHNFHAEHTYNKTMFPDNSSYSIRLVAPS
jgi:hypothetical protein